MVKFHIVVLVLAVSKLALTARVDELGKLELTQAAANRLSTNDMSINGKVTTRDCKDGGGNGTEFEFHVEGCNTDWCGVEDEKKYEINAGWKFGGKETVPSLSVTLMVIIKDQELTYPSPPFSPGPEGLVPGQKYWFNQTVPMIKTELKNEKIVVRVKLMDNTRTELCKEADVTLNGVGWILVPATLLLSLQMLLRFF